MQKVFIFFLLFVHFDIHAQEQERLGIANYLEIGGKGFFSANVDLGIGTKDRLTVSLTALDNEFTKENEEDENYPNLVLPTPGIMYLHLFGRERHYFEAGFGASISPVFWKEYSENDSPLSLHGCLGYRMQSPERFFFRAGLTPFYRVKWAFLPLIGVSFGYSW